MKTFKRVVVKKGNFPYEEITQLQKAEFPKSEFDLRNSGGYSDIGIQNEIDKGSQFFLQEIECNYAMKVISESIINNPTIAIVHELNAYPESLKNW